MASKGTALFMAASGVGLVAVFKLMNGRDAQANDAQPLVAEKEIRKNVVRKPLLISIEPRKRHQ